MRWKYIFVLIFLYFAYLLIGAAVFWALENPHEEKMCKEIIDELRKYNLSSNGTNANITSTQLKDFLQLILSADENGVQFDASYQPSCSHNWNFQNAFFFAGTVLTTIGYGNIAPKTSGGQTFCIFFATMGLPLFGIMFSEIGHKMAKVFRRIDRKLKRMGRKKRLRKLVVLLTSLVTLLVFFLLIPAAIFIAVEAWTYHEAFYYSFISLTTIGLGDFVVGTNPDISYISIYRVAVYFWILFGLAFMATVISLFSDVIKEKASEQLKADSESSAGPSERGEEADDGMSDDSENEEEEEHTIGERSEAKKISSLVKPESQNDDNYKNSDETSSLKEDSEQDIKGSVEKKSTDEDPSANN